MDANKSELQVTFDQPMNSGYSFVGGGRAFPEVTGQPEWITARTLVLPVKLEPDREYRLRINADRHQNLRGSNGLSAIPYPLSFRTAPTGAPDTLNGGLNRQSLEQLKSAIDTQHSHGDLRNVDRNSILDAYESGLLAARTRTEFARLAGRAMGTAPDPPTDWRRRANASPAFKRMHTRTQNCLCWKNRYTVFDTSDPPWQPDDFPEAPHT